MADDASPVLGFDFGRRRIGVAVGSRTSGAASPIECVTCRDGHPDWDAVGRLISEWHPAILIVGLPYNSDGSESDMSRAARRFGHRLGARFGLPIAFVDERLSSREAARVLAERRRQGHRRRIRKGDVDEMAAAIILQNWLDGAGQEGKENG